MTTVFERIEQKLQQQEIDFQVMRHEPVYTSEEAARVRGVDLASGAKALICKVDAEFDVSARRDSAKQHRFVMFVMPADRRLASKRVRKENGFRKLRFATGEEVLEMTGLKPGSIPPFGSLFELPTWCDQRLAEQQRINFNAGDHSISVSMTYDDYVASENPKIADISDEVE